MICMKNLRFSSRPRAKVGRHGPPGSARAQPWSCKWSHKSTYDLVKIQNRSHKRSHKHYAIGVRRIRTFPFFLTPLITPSPTFLLWWKPDCRSRKQKCNPMMINQSHCTLPCFVIGLVLPLLLVTPMTQFLLDHKRRSCKWNENAVFTRS